jgi:acylphosphatase
MTSAARRIVVEGRVQGVGFRWWTVGQAHALGLTGWVRNRRDGTVEILAAGESAAIERLIAACREGPPGAAVRSVQAEPAQDEGVMDFEQRATL